MLKPLLVANWIALTAGFLAAEFFTVNQNHRWAGLVFVFWFLTVELWQVYRASAGSPGGTLSESVGAFAAGGVVWARVVMVWCLCAAMTFRLLVISAEISGHVTHGQLPYLLDEGPTLLCIAGILLWLPAHFIHLARETHEQATDRRDRGTDLGRMRDS